MSVNIGSRGCSSGKTRVENDDFVAIELEVVVVVIVVVPLAIHQNVFSSSSSSVSLTIIVPVVFLKQTFKYYHFLFYFVICNNNVFFTTTFLRRRGLKNSKMDFVSSLYETFSGQTLGRPNKKTTKKTPQKKSSSQLAKKSLKSPQNAKVKKKASSKTPRASPLLTKVPRPNLKSITNKPLPPPSKKEKSNETSDARTTTTTTTRETKKNAAYDVSSIQSALAKGEDLRPVMQKIETKKRAILGEIDALERETKRKKKEVVELEKALLLGANRW